MIIDPPARMLSYFRKRFRRAITWGNALVIAEGILVDLFQGMLGAAYPDGAIMVRPINWR